MGLNLTANFRGINTSAYLNTNCKSTTCGGIEELKSLMVSHCFVFLLFNKVIRSVQSKWPQTLWCSDRWRQINPIFAAGSLCFCAHSWCLTIELWMFYQNVRTCTMKSHEDKVSTTTYFKNEGRSTDALLLERQPWKMFRNVLSEVRRTRLRRAWANVHDCHSRDSWVSVSLPHWHHHINEGAWQGQIQSHFQTGSNHFQQSIEKTFGNNWFSNR